MKYFVMEESLDKKIVGRDFPQAYRFIKGYNEDCLLYTSDIYAEFTSNTDLPCYGYTIYGLQNHYLDIQPVSYTHLSISLQTKLN